MRGLVIKNTGSWYTVLTDDGQLVDCKIKGTFRLKGIRSTNPVAVGDRVTISFTVPELVEGPRSTAFISEIEDRKNYIIRRSQNLSKQSHIIAANVDQAFLVVTVNYPQTSTTFIDRFLASAEAYRVPVVLIFNKTDRLDADELHYQQMMVQLYETIGYTCKQISAATGDGVEDLRPLLEGKITESKASAPSTWPPRNSPATSPRSSASRKTAVSPTVPTPTNPAVPSSRPSKTTTSPQAAISPTSP